MVLILYMSVYPFVKSNGAFDLYACGFGPSLHATPGNVIKMPDT